MIQFTLEIGDPALAEKMEPVRKQAEEAVAALPGVLSVTAIMTAERSSDKPAPQPQQQSAPQQGGTGPGQV